jgi:hypothetical protein
LNQDRATQGWLAQDCSTQDGPSQRCSTYCSLRRPLNSRNRRACRLRYSARLGRRSNSERFSYDAEAWWRTAWAELGNSEFGWLEQAQVGRARLFVPAALGAETRTYPGSVEWTTLRRSPRAAGLRLAEQLRGRLAITNLRSTDKARGLRPDSYLIRCAAKLLESYAAKRD